MMLPYGLNMTSGKTLFEAAITSLATKKPNSVVAQNLLDMKFLILSCLLLIQNTQKQFLHM